MMAATIPSPTSRRRARSGSSAGDEGFEEETEEDEKARLVAERAEFILRSTEFFLLLEASSPGLLSKLAAKVKFIKHVEKQVMFRQGDPPGCCYVIVSGQVSVKIWKSSDGQERRLSFSQADEACPTPRTRHVPKKCPTLIEVRERTSVEGYISGQIKEEDQPPPVEEPEPEEEIATLEGAKPKRTGWKAAKFKINAMRMFAAPPPPQEVEQRGKSMTESQLGSHVEDIRKVQAEDAGTGIYRSVEKYSTFHKASILGQEVTKLGPGKIFGELALKNHKPRAATVQCITEEVEFLVVPKDVYDKVLKAIMDKNYMTHTAYNVLMQSKFFTAMEETSPGITKEVAVDCKLSEEPAEQVLFRQGDPPKDCYAVMEGKLEVFVFKEVDKKGKKVHKRDHPTPRDVQLNNIDKLTTIKQDMEHHKKKYAYLSTDEARERAMKRGEYHDFAVWGHKGKRYKSSEGHSSYSEESKYGEMIVTLGSSAVVGELALQNDNQRAATVRCSTDCKLLVITKEIFQKVLGQVVVKIRYFDQHLPGLKDMKYRENHPSVFFRKRIFPPGYKFLFEGIVASEPAAFLLISGSVEFRRYRKSQDNFAYVQGTRPLAVKAGGPASPGRDSPRSSPSPRASTAQPRNGPRRGSVHDAGPSLIRKPPASRAGFEVTCDTLRDHEVFCTMPFLPLSVVEPFTVVSKTAVEAYHLGGNDAERLPAVLLKALRTHLLKGTTERVKRAEKQISSPPFEASRLPTENTVENAVENAAQTWPNFRRRR